ENAFVNAKLYYALILWAKIEEQLGDIAKAKYYIEYAVALKKSFNKPTSEGGFWDEKNQWYVHWLDKDGSVHGNNLVVPVNFMAISYGICDDESRKRAILDKVEDQMQKENLFAWPICMYSYAPGEGNDWQFPFPNYENGDIFLSWGAVGVDAYASYKPELALKYVENILTRYEKDGLAFQRYGRLKQDGLGDDILSGNSLALVGLYKSIYGINPKYNRLYLDPHLPDKLSGTTLNYLFRGEKLKIELNPGRYAVSNFRFKIVSAEAFGFNATGNSLEYFRSNSDSYALRAQLTKPGNLTIAIKNWNEGFYAWEQIASTNKGKLVYRINGLKPDLSYEIIIDDLGYKSIKSSADGNLEFRVQTKKGLTAIQIR
ncbi:MAG TPA: glycosyl hydrolase family 65 protein, partial [Chitinophagaceae bacterium]|nr:glycosyl hydrolase family 65 protein [Chitinophagaceae bacterium]